MSEKIPYWESNRFLKAFVHRTGEEGCVVCTDDTVKLSLDRAPPPMRDPPEPAKASTTADKSERKPTPDFLDNMLESAIKTAETWRRFKAWTQSPPRETQQAPLENQDLKPEPFDIQEIPKTLKKLGLPLAAKMFQKWFSGRLNYSMTNEDTNKELDQNGEPYGSDMIDRTSITLKWVLSFERAAVEREKLLEHAMLTTKKATKTLIKILSPHTGTMFLQPGVMLDYNAQKIHQGFQFQIAPVEGTLNQKLEQFLKQEVKNRGIPDELTFILGSFNLMAAVARAVILPVHGGHAASVTHIYIYARDGFTFTDDKNKGSQYLGHWNKTSVSVVPIHQIVMNMIKTDRKGYAIFESPSSFNFSLMYPIRNSNFRDWQLKHQQGGDFIIYTDLEANILDKPIEVFIPSTPSSEAE